MGGRRRIVHATVVGVMLAAVLAWAGAAFAQTTCAVDDDCDDQIVCNGVETCDVDSGTCLPGTPTGDPDSDGDGVCDPDDNCPADFNPDQLDLFGGPEGDACETPDAVLGLNKVRVKINPRGKPDSGIVKLKGFFTLMPGTEFEGATGLTIRVRSNAAAPLDVRADLAPEDCRPQGVGGLKCKSSDRTQQALFKNLRPSPEVYRFKATLKRIDLPGDFDKPITVTVTDGGTDRVGEIADCVAKVTGLVCREF